MLLALWFTRTNLSSLGYVFRFCFCNDDGLFFCLAKPILLARGHVPSTNEKSPRAETTGPVAAAAAHVEMNPVPKCNPAFYGQKISVLLKWGMTDLEKGSRLSNSSSRPELLSQLLTWQLPMDELDGTSVYNASSWKQVEKGEKNHSGFISRLKVCVCVPASSHELGV